ncbi:MAG: hypothetical protein K940chlam9_00210 [Chlamydiae bacterium]|nr:hypothetical protein [Chlamydiota bacterium]
MDPAEVVHLRCMGTVGLKRLIGALQGLGVYCPTPNKVKSRSLNIFVTTAN